jgi:formylmethanofuran dehydrogenase subunit E
MTPCDRCGELFPDYEIAHLWFGTEDRFLCGLCQETSPDVDRQIDQMRGK